MTKKKTQCDKILSYMKGHKRGITGLQALRNCSCMNLPARILDLRKKGYTIIDEFVVVPNADGDKCRVKQYRLVK